MSQKILFIEDDELVRETLIQVLELGEYEVVAAEDGDIGLRKLEDSPDTDMVITDILLPRKEGIEVIMAIRKVNQDIPILAISGGDRFGELSYLDLAIKLGANDALSKPFPPQELLNKVSELLGTGSD